jgi:hypothetical protein
MARLPFFEVAQCSVVLQFHPEAYSFLEILTFFQNIIS